MFTPNFHARVEKHLGVFRKTVAGLYQVKNDIELAIDAERQRKKDFEGAIEDCESQIEYFSAHADQIGVTISKINVLLPDQN